MQKSWLILGGSVISLLAVISLYSTAERQQPRATFQVSLQPLLPVLVNISPMSVDANRWSMPSYQDYIAAWQGRQAAITLNETDLAAHQKAIEGNSTADNLELSDSYGSVHSAPFFITQLKQGLASLRNRPEQLSGLQPILQSSMFAVSFRSSDQAYIERYANRHHASEDALEFQYLDTNTIEMLMGFRRGLVDDIAAAEGDFTDQAASPGEELPRPGLEVAPGGGQYWIEDPNAAWW